MKKFILLSAIGFSLLSSCAKEWSEVDQNTFLEDCNQFSEDSEHVCNCGLKKAMESYKTLEEAQTAIQNMDSHEVEEFFAGCL